MNYVAATADRLPVIVWEQVRVITTELLAKQYGTDEKNIQQNYARNADRFIEGTHFFRLEGAALREFKKAAELSFSTGRAEDELTLSEKVSLGECLDPVGVVPKHSRQIILWTERGAARHAKMLETDAAWDVFEALEDFYFRAKEAQQTTSSFTAEEFKLARNDSSQGYRAMSGMLAMHREDLGKSSLPHHFSNEALMLNEIIFGVRKAIDRDSLHPEQLALLGKMELRNALLIGKGLAYGERKDLLKKYHQKLISAPPPKTKMLKEKRV